MTYENALQQYIKATNTHSFENAMFLSRLTGTKTPTSTQQ